MDSSKLINIIRKIVKEEVKRIVKPLINEVLADKFIQTINEKKETIQEVYNVKTEEVNKKNQLEKKKLRQELLKKVAGDNPMNQLIFEDVEPGRGMGNLTAPTSFIDVDDDEGVDLSKFGL